MELELKKVGDNIRIARAIKGYSQEGLANALGKTQNWIQNMSGEYACIPNGIVGGYEY
jgi:ribosome-binding protein aMBF1 (putative translation factor)